MDIPFLASLSQIIQVVLVIPSLFLVLRQLRLTTHLTQASNMQHLTDQAFAFNSLLYQHTDLAELWYSHGVNFAMMEPLDQVRYREMLVQWLIFHENIFHQHKQGLLNPAIYRSWKVDLIYTIEHHNLKALLRDPQYMLPNEFGNEIRTIMKRQFERENHRCQ